MKYRKLMLAVSTFVEHIFVFTLQILRNAIELNGYDGFRSINGLLLMAGPGGVDPYSGAGVQ
jgi:hypothetical protein